jgi:hypothetical protein
MFAAVGISPMCRPRAAGIRGTGYASKPPNRAALSDAGADGTAERVYPGGHERDDRERRQYQDCCGSRISDAC